MKKFLAAISAVLVLLALCACEKTQLPLLDQHPHIDTQYYPDGKTILCETEYGDGGICIRETFYAANGVKATETCFNADGKPISATQYDEDGRLAERIEYEYDSRGNVINEKQYTPDGVSESSNDE